MPRAGPHLFVDHRRRGGERFRHLAERAEVRVLSAEGGGEVDLPHRPVDLDRVARFPGLAEQREVCRVHQGAVRAAAVGGSDRQGPDPLGVGESELLGDHPAHRDPDDVDALEPKRVEQRQGVAGEVDDRERHLGPRRAPHPAVVEDDAFEVALQRLEEGPAPGQPGRGHALDQEHRLPRPRALVVELGPPCIDAGHRPDPMLRPPRCRGRCNVVAKSAPRRRHLPRRILRRPCGPLPSETSRTTLASSPVEEER